MTGHFEYVRKPWHPHGKTDKTILANVGYARVSTQDQDLSLQLNALAAADCARVFEVAQRNPDGGPRQWRVAVEVGPQNGEPLGGFARPRTLAVGHPAW